MSTPPVFPKLSRDPKPLHHFRSFLCEYRMGKIPKSTAPRTVARGLSVNSASAAVVNRTGQIPGLASPFLTSGRVDCRPSAETTVGPDGQTATQHSLHPRNPHSVLHRRTHTQTPPVAPYSLRSYAHTRDTDDSCSSDLQTRH